MSLYDDASLIMYPSGVKASKIYCQKPTDGTGDLTFARAGTKTYIDANGARQTAAANVMPVSYEDGGCGKFNFEPQRTNLLLNSNTLSTQNITTTAQSYVLSFEGTGTVTLSGTYAGSLVGTGATPADRVNLVFTATAGTLTLTVSGSVINAQVEAGDYATSYIPTTGATATRIADVISNFTSAAIFGTPSTGTFYMHCRLNGIKSSSAAAIFRFGDASAGLQFALYVDNKGLNAYNYSAPAGFIVNTSNAQGSFVKIAIVWNGNEVTAFKNGVKYTTVTRTTGNFSIDRISNMDMGGVNALGIQSMIINPSAMSDVDVLALTTI